MYTQHYTFIMYTKHAGIPGISLGIRTWNRQSWLDGHLDRIVWHRNEKDHAHTSLKDHTCTWLAVSKSDVASMTKKRSCLIFFKYMGTRTHVLQVPHVCGHDQECFDYANEVKRLSLISLLELLCTHTPTNWWRFKSTIIANQNSTKVPVVLDGLKIRSSDLSE